MDLQTSYKDISTPKLLYENYIEDKLDHDLIIPDYYCPAQKIVRCEADAIVNNCSLNDKRVILEGECRWRILYLSEEDDLLHHIECQESFTEIFAVTVTEGNVRYKIKTKSVSCKLQSPSRAECKTSLCIALKIEGAESKKILADVGASCVQLKDENLNFFELKEYRQKSFNVTGELLLKQRDEFDVYKCTSDVIVKECKCFEGKATIRGCCKNKLILLSKNRRNAETLEIESNFTQMVEAENITQSMLPCVHCRTNDTDVSISTEQDSEMLLVNNSVVADVYVYCPSEASVHDDAYHIDNELEFECENIPVYRDIQQFELLTHLTQKTQLSTTDISVLYFDSSVEIEKIDAHEEMMIIDGMLLVHCLYTVNENVLFKSFTFPFQNTRRLEGDYDSLRCEASASVDNFSFLIINDNEMEIGCDCRISMTVYFQESRNVISTLHIGEMKEKNYLNTPLVLYYGSKGENLWDICKKYSVPLEVVKQNNNLETMQLTDDQLVLITKH